MRTASGLKRALTPAFFLALAASLLTCRTGPVNYDRFEQRTIETNLGAIDSAGSIYSALFLAGDIDAAAEQARAYLAAQEGVDAVRIADDSTVWAFFTCGLLAGLGREDIVTTAMAAAGPALPPEVRSQAGGEVGDFCHYVLPFHEELPCTKTAADAITGSSRAAWPGTTRRRSPAARWTSA
jgi:hypothetical protein